VPVYAIGLLRFQQPDRAREEVEGTTEDILARKEDTFGYCGAERHLALPIRVASASPKSKTGEKPIPSNWYQKYARMAFSTLFSLERCPIPELRPVEMVRNVTKKVLHLAHGFQISLRVFFCSEKIINEQRERTTDKLRRRSQTYLKPCPLAHSQQEKQDTPPKLPFY
jgi:hypothetical protein